MSFLSGYLSNLPGLFSMFLLLRINLFASFLQPCQVFLLAVLLELSLLIRLLRLSNWRVVSETHLPLAHVILTSGFFQGVPMALLKLLGWVSYDFYNYLEIHKFYTREKCWKSILMVIGSRSTEIDWKSYFFLSALHLATSSGVFPPWWTLKNKV